MTARDRVTEYLAGRLASALIDEGDKEGARTFGVMLETVANMNDADFEEAVCDPVLA